MEEKVCKVIVESARTRVGTSAICLYVLFGNLVEHFSAFALGSLSVIFVILLLCAWCGCTILSLGVRLNRLLLGSCGGCTILSLGVRRI